MQKNISLCGHAHRATKLTCPSRLVPLAVDSNTHVGDSVDWWVYALAPNAVMPRGDALGHPVVLWTMCRKLSGCT